MKTVTGETIRFRILYVISLLALYMINTSKTKTKKESEAAGNDTRVANVLHMTAGNNIANAVKKENGA
ncbi:MAG: hypothetical protein Q4F40_02565 [Akkermansia sp.]|nr:hypothetical protein [Akkermansia sp.]